MGIMVYSLLWVMQDLYHQQSHAGIFAVLQCGVANSLRVEVALHRAREDVCKRTCGSKYLIALYAQKC